MNKDIKVMGGEIVSFWVRHSFDVWTLRPRGALNKAAHVPCSQTNDGVAFVPSYLLGHTEDGTQHLIQKGKH